MNKTVNEKILDFINKAEKRKVRKDIRSGPIKIGERYHEFEETEFFDEKLKMYIPKDFEDMPLEARKVKYPSESRSEIIKSNRGGIEVNSDKKIILNVGDDIEINGVSIEGEFHIKGNNVIKNESNKEAYAYFT